MFSGLRRLWHIIKDSNVHIQCNQIRCSCLHTTEPALQVTAAASLSRMHSMSRAKSLQWLALSSFWASCSCAGPAPAQGP